MEYKLIKSLKRLERSHFKTFTKYFSQNMQLMNPVWHTEKNTGKLNFFERNVFANQKQVSASNFLQSNYFLTKI